LSIVRAFRNKGEFDFGLLLPLIELSNLLLNNLTFLFLTIMYPDSNDTGLFDGLILAGG
jgi:hypothetical protein